MTVKLRPTYILLDGATIQFGNPVDCIIYRLGAHTIATPDMFKPATINPTVYGNQGAISLSSLSGEINASQIIVPGLTGEGSLDLSAIGVGDLDDIIDGASFVKVLNGQVTDGSIVLSAVLGDLDDVTDGSTYGKILLNQITSGSITLSAAYGDLDDIADGGTYEKVLKTQITAGSIRLDAVYGDLDDVTDGSTYGKVLTTQISSGSIILGQATGDLDDISDGSTYGKILKTGISAGSITLEEVYQDPSGTYKKITRLGAGEIYTNHIGVNQITTNELQFNRISASEPTKAGALYYWQPKDQLRFIGDAGEKGYIARFPVTTHDAPAENLLFNSSFEDDIDGNNIPDFWELVGADPPYWTTTDPDKGGHHIVFAITGGSGQSGSAYSEKFLVRGNKKYFVSYRSKYVAGVEDQVRLVVHWYEKDKTTLAATSSVLWSGSNASWTTISTEFTSHADARYAQVELFLWQPTNSTTIYIDDVIFSEQKAIIPTSGIVANVGYYSGGWVSCANGAWTAMGNFAMPSGDGEMFVFQISVRREGDATYLYGRVRLKIDNVYYPYDNSTDFAHQPRVVVSSQEDHWKEDSLYITVPKNIASKTVYIGFRNDNTTQNHLAYIIGWGHSEHRHQ